MSARASHLRPELTGYSFGATYFMLNFIMLSESFQGQPCIVSRPGFRVALEGGSAQLRGRTALWWSSAE